MPTFYYFFIVIADVLSEIPLSEKLQIENTWYYYFSTISQTVSAFSAILLAVALIRVQGLNTLIIQSEKSISSIFISIGLAEDYASCHKMFLTDSIEDYIGNIFEISSKVSPRFTKPTVKYETSKMHLLKLIEDVKNCSAKKKTINKIIFKIVIASLLIAFLSILLIPVVHFINIIVLIFALMLSVGSLSLLSYYYIQLILKI